MDFPEEKSSSLCAPSPCLSEEVHFPADPSLAMDEIGLRCSSPCVSKTMPASSRATINPSHERASPPSMSSEKDSTIKTKPALRKRLRKSRAKPKGRITQLTASNLNFKDIVHQFTGLPSPNMQKTFNLRPSVLSQGKDRASASACKSSLPAPDAEAANPSCGSSLAVLDAAAKLTQALRVLESILSSGTSTSFADGAQDQAFKSKPEGVHEIIRKAAPTSGRSSSGHGGNSQARAHTVWRCRHTNSVPSPPIMFDMEIQDISETVELEGLSKRTSGVHKLQEKFLPVADLVKKHLAANSHLPSEITSLIHATK